VKNYSSQQEQRVKGRLSPLGEEQQLMALAVEGKKKDDWAQAS